MPFSSLHNSGINGLSTASRSSIRSASFRKTVFIKVSTALTKTTILIN